MCLYLLKPHLFDMIYVKNECRKGKFVQVRENLKRGTVEMVLLHLLQERDMYGYELIQKMNERSKGKFTLKDGSMYPILYRMIDKGLITDEQVLVGRRRTRVYYHLTDIGKKYLEDIKEEYFFITEGISSILSYQEENDENN